MAVWEVEMPGGGGRLGGGGGGGCNRSVDERFSRRKRDQRRKKRRRRDGARRPVRTMIEVHVLTCAYLLWMLARRVCRCRENAAYGTAALSSLFPRGRHPPMAPRRFLLESDDESAERACEPPDTASNHPAQC